ncbi:hypothetical protein O3P69_003788 [Scylla paramamosain]|uniref:Uncharacterized protein n=1 Tax=Scylla paramamosain TaxID=85552 RepID=A0AAW0UD92_SCYPA
MLPRVRFPWITPLITTGHECQGDTTLHHPTCCLYHTWEHHLEYQLSRYSPQPSQPILPPPVPTSTRPSSLKVCGSCQEQQEPCRLSTEDSGSNWISTAAAAATRYFSGRISDRQTLRKTHTHTHTHTARLEAP